MGLENGTYISDLNPNNPVHISDSVGESDDHHRLIKSTILNTFPNITGEVSLSHLELNDAALQTADNDFSGANTFGEGQTFVGVAPVNILRDSSNVAVISYSTTVEGLLGYAGFNQAGAFSTYDSDAESSGFAVSPTGDLIATSYSNILASNLLSRVRNEAISGGWSVSGDWEFSRDLTLTNSRGIISRTFADDGDIALTYADANDVVRHGAPYADMRADFVDTYEIRRNNTQVAEYTSRAFGSLLVYDSGGVPKKAGFRNPSAVIITANRTVTQADEGKILIVNGAGGITLTFPTLEVASTFRVLNRSSAPITLAGPFEWIQGGNVGGGNRTLGAWSVAEMYYYQASNISLFGNGIT